MKLAGFLLVLDYAEEVFCNGKIHLITTGEKSSDAVECDCSNKKGE